MTVTVTNMELGHIHNTHIHGEKLSWAIDNDSGVLHVRSDKRVVASFAPGRWLSVTNGDTD